jgi:hypothetical protein
MHRLIYRQILPRPYLITEAVFISCFGIAAVLLLDLHCTLL